MPCLSGARTKYLADYAVLDDPKGSPRGWGSCADVRWLFGCDFSAEALRSLDHPSGRPGSNKNVQTSGCRAAGSRGRSQA